ncbi:DUF6160 family protein [Acinetobacter seifertii]|uniref:DUF6160 domain-containing protein n=1 Tax=Acinetobacter seifertii TaxID=1530123 RepID=A0A7H2QJ86_9GAMM|nr:DUF6160 family protein [Acinetobacter seifertii]QNX04631.1 hypothetical protein IC796_14995 [Acinetobacter seifertii]QNX15169.1 hypothetical protein IC793_14770 [Acinetobacter seifertii]
MKNKNIVCWLLLTSSSSVFAMQPLDDQSLSAATGQNGLTLGIQADKVKFNQVALIDTNGIASTSYNSKAGLVIAGNSTNPVPSIEFIKATVSTNPSFNIAIDTDAGAGKPFVNLAVTMGSDVNGIRLTPFSVYLAPNTSVSSPADYAVSSYAPKSIFSSGTTVNTGVKELVRSTGNLDINFVQTNKPRLNIQLGHAAQYVMVKFGGALQSICSAAAGCPITLVSDTTGASFGFKFAGTNAATGFLLDGFYAGVDPTGLTFGNTGVSSKFDASLNNVTLGNLATQSTTTFNNLPNGSMGSFGVTGASVTDFKMKVSGF